MSQNKNLPTYLSLDEAAEMLSVSVKTLRRRISEGSLPGYRCGRRHIRVRLDELESTIRRIPSSGS
jgi:excisionase family DNA binding protein